MFYTTYRPQSFSQISRPNQAADALSEQLKNKKTAHAYLFIGPRGTGKTTAARILAKALNCENPLPEGDCCNECKFCTQIQSGNYSDLIEIDAASNRGIDDIRSLREKVKLAPVNGKVKVYIIDEVHMLTNEAFNALLKTLEEPPKHVVFILCTTEEHKVPETIKSRCQVFKFSRATVPQLIKKLTQICDAEGVKVFETQEEFEKSKAKKKILQTSIEKIAKNANGGFRDAETQLEQYIVSGGIYWDDGNTTPQEFLYLLATKNKAKALQAIADLHSTGNDISNFSSNVIYLCRDVVLSKSGVDLVSAQPELQKLSEEFQTAELVNLLTLLIDAHSKIKTSVIPQLPLELVIVTYCDEPNEELPQQKQKTPKTPAQQPDYDDDAFDTKISFEVLKQAAKQTEPSHEPEAVDDQDGQLEEDVAQLAQLLDEVLQKWEDIITTASKLNNSVTAILKASRPIKIDGGYLVLEVQYKFHKERLETTKNKELVEQAILEHTHGIKSIKCVLSEEKPKTMNKFESGELTDLNISPVSQNPISKDNATGFFDGGLPIV